MDNTYINILLEKYWECGTSVEEERELHTFFTKSVIPPELLPYKTWFVAPGAEDLLPLGDGFDEQVLTHIAQLKKRRRNQYITRYICIGSLAFTLLLVFLCLKLFLS